MSKSVRWLESHEAEDLGLKPKKNEKGRKNARYSINEEQWEDVKSYRELSGKNLSLVGQSTLRDSDGNLVMEWTKTKVSEEDRVKNINAVINTLKENIEPAKPVRAPLRVDNDNLCNQYTLTDYHLGMMAWGEETGADWDMKIAEDVLVGFFEQAMEQSPKANNAIFAQIGDFLHWDGMDAVTPANKHLLDADTRFTKLVRVAIRTIKRVIKMLLGKYQHVTVIMAEGNHDPASSIWLREVLSSFYEDEPRLTIDTNPDPYYCVTWGKCCLFYHHGHKRSLNNIDTVFVSKFKKEFGQAEHVYGHTGHLHNLQIKETNLMLIEQHRTLAAKDAYASRGGYGSGRDSKVITYHKEFGEVSRSIISIDMINRFTG